ncbi:hypothetical protein V1517DRAFT_319186 [Lipomyces orientalis]|uniref:Uncharacterized protein n=1 Tax=Lipomyces orientalis TaxID=1233043 RepID=A0ACC3TRQ8_9ASCO
MDAKMAQATPTRRSTRNIPRKSYRLSPEPENFDLDDQPTDEPVEEDDIVYEDDNDDMEDMELVQDERLSSPEPEKIPKPSVKIGATEGTTGRDSRTKLKRKARASDFGLSEDEFAEIEEVFLMGCDSDGRFVADNIEDAIIALGLESSQKELREIMKTADPQSGGFIDRYIFIEIMAYKYQERKAETSAGVDAVNRDEIEHAFKLFMNNRPGRQYITLQDLRNAAVLAKDDVTDEDLQEMLRVASGNAYGTVSLENFAAVMRKSGAIL